MGLGDDGIRKKTGSGRLGPFGLAIRGFKEAFKFLGQTLIGGGMIYRQPFREDQYNIKKLKNNPMTSL